MGKTPPGETRRKVYEYVKGRILEGDSPSIREVQREFGFRAVQSAREHLETLIAEGLLAKLPGRARGFRLPSHHSPSRHSPSDIHNAPSRFVPLLGRVAAGELTTALQEPSGYLPVHSRLPESELFALRVRGESMTGAGIFHDDFVIVHHGSDAKSGDIVVALVDEEATVKRLRLSVTQKGRSVELVPENPAFDVIRPDPERLHLLGKVIEIRRYLEEPPLQGRP